MKKKIFLLVGLAVLLLSSCHTPNLAYVEDMRHGEAEVIAEAQDLRFRTDDRLSIVVHSRNSELSALFNLVSVSKRVGSSSNDNGSNTVMGYTIDSKGEIDFPVLGNVKVAGFNREELAKYIKTELMRRNLVDDPVVTVEYAGLGFNVLGEVRSPGHYYFDRDHYTLFDAISKAGDLTINGKRENVTVIREVGNTRTAYKVNLRSGKDVYNSPAFYLQQNDIVYVEPTNKRERESTVLGNTLYTPTFWMSLTSFLLTIGLLIFK